jgi:RND family efflux transporter MFP subunit
MRQVYGLCGILIVGVLLGCGVGCSAELAADAATEPGDPSAPADGGAKADLVSVTTILPQRTSLSRTTTQPASVHAYYQTELYAKISGYLAELNTDIGQEVDAGAVLCRISVPEMDKAREKQQATICQLQAEEKRAAAGVAVAEAALKSSNALLDQSRAEVASTQAQLKADRSEYDRFTELVESKAVADRLGDEALRRFNSAQAKKSAAEAAVASADANLGVAAARLDAAQADLAAAAAKTDVAVKELEEIDTLLTYATLRSPLKGVVTQRHAEPGDLIKNTPASGPPLFVVAEVDKVRVRMPIPERDAHWVNAGDPATLSFQALPGKSFSGTVSRTSGELAEDTRTIGVEIDLENPGRLLLPGFFGKATVVLHEQSDALVLPASAVRHDEAGRSCVYAVSTANRVQVLDVTTGIDDGQTIEIIDGLDGSERIVDAMIGRLKPDQEVRVRVQ